MLCILKTTVGTNPRGVLHLILISLAVERIEKRPDKAWNDRKRGSSNIMYSLGQLIVDLETARRRILYVFEVPDGTATSGLRTRPIPDGPHPIGLLTRLKTPWDLPRADTAGFLRLSKRQGTEPSHAECQRAPRENS
jgi:hypothetical protein